MARYQEMFHAAEDELKKLKAQGDGITRLSARLIMLEAALAVLMKHDLLGELAAEHSRLQDAIALPNGERS